MGARWNPLPAAHPPPPPLPEPGVGEMVGVGSPVGVGVPDGVTPPSAFTWKVVRRKLVATVRRRERDERLIRGAGNGRRAVP
jgi:hypothetical protein